MSKTTLLLDRTDLNSQAYLKIKEFVGKRIDEMRKENDTDKGADKTANLRGKIAFAKELLNAAEPKTVTGHVSGAKYNN